MYFFLNKDFDSPDVFETPDEKESIESEKPVGVDIFSFLIY